MQSMLMDGCLVTQTNVSQEADNTEMDIIMGRPLNDDTLMCSSLVTSVNLSPKAPFTNTDKLKFGHG